MRARQLKENINNGQQQQQQRTQTLHTHTCAHSFKRHYKSLGNCSGMTLSEGSFDERHFLPLDCAGDDFPASRTFFSYFICYILCFASFSDRFNAFFPSTASIGFLCALKDFLLYHILSCFLSLLLLPRLASTHDQRGSPSSGCLQHQPLVARSLITHGKRGSNRSDTTVLNRAG